MMQFGLHFAPAKLTARRTNREGRNLVEPGGTLVAKGVGRGAGGRLSPSNSRSVVAIAVNASKKPWFGQAAPADG